MLKFQCIWKASILIYSPLTIKNMIFRFKFYLLSFIQCQSIPDFFGATDNDYFIQVIKARPDMLGILVWPYIHKDWSFIEKYNVIKMHYNEVKNIPALCIGIDDSKKIFDVNNAYDGLKVVIDKSKWYMREGELVLNLFVGDERLYSLAFTCGKINNKKTVYIGGIQGVNIENILDIYKQITKALYGMRPRDFLLKVLIIICSELGIEQILGIANKNRHHNHNYFKLKTLENASVNYDDIWEDLGAVEDKNGFYCTKPKLNLRPLNEIASKKRSMYRKRYALLDDISSDISIYLRSA